MTRSPSPRLRTLSMSALAATMALLLAACGGSSSPGSDDPVIGQDASRSPSASPDRPTAGGAPGGTASGAAAATPGSTGVGKTTTGGTGSTSGGSSTKGGTAAGGSTTTGSSTDVAPGRYTYDNSGTFTAGTPRPVKSTSTLTVDKPSGGTQHSVLGGDQGSTEQTVRRNETGTYLTQLKIDNAAFSKEFAPVKPVLLVPRPAKVGRTWSWSMTSTDGKTTASFNGTITKSETLTVGGKKTPTVVIESTLKLSGDIDYTAKTTTYYDEVHLLQVKDRTRGSGSFSGFPFSTDITSVLRSTTPS